MWGSFSNILLNLKLTFSNAISKYDEDQDLLKKYPTIAFILPSYHEPFEVAKMTFDSAYNIKYQGKKEIIIVDNSKDTSSKDFKDWKAYVESFIYSSSSISVKFIYNNEQEGLKPGNLDLAQQYIEDSEYVIFLDIDSSLPYDEKMIEKSIAEFTKDESLGWIQYITKSTNHHFNNCSQAIGVFQNLSRITCFFRSQGGFTLFYGHNAIWRKSCLQKLGPWLEEHRGQIMVTEDILKTIIAYNIGYHGKSIPVYTGEWVPSSLRALENMWQRWTYGTYQVIEKYFSKILKSKQMTIPEKYDLFHFVMIYWGSAIMYPMVILFQFLLPPETSWVFVLILCIIPQAFGGITIYRHYIKDQPVNFFKKLFHLYTGSFVISGFVIIVQLKGTFNYLLNVPQGWKVTAKGIENSENWISIIRKYKLYLAFSILLFASSIICWQINFGNEIAKLVYYFPVIFISINLFLSILIFGKSGRIKENLIHTSTIDFFNGDENREIHLTESVNELIIENVEQEKQELIEAE
jgi:cellulose synthase/poly-beta-1,6-N-acetylglucosamine synthase-like glycosyltransferase